MTGVWITNDDDAGALILRVWHRSNPFASDGDSSWLDDRGTPVAERSGDHFLPPGQTRELAVREDLAFTVLPDSTADAKGIVDSVRRYFRTGSTDSGTSVDTARAAPFSLKNAGTVPLRIRLFASSTFQFVPLRDFSLAAGETAQLSTGEEGISVRVG